MQSDTRRGLSKAAPTVPGCSVGPTFLVTFRVTIRVTFRVTFRVIGAPGVREQGRAWPSAKEGDLRFREACPAAPEATVTDAYPSSWRAKAAELVMATLLTNG